MDTQALLEARHTARLQWKEPWPALAAEGSRVDAHVTLSATVHDCVNMQRHKGMAIERVRAKDAELLESFMAVNWAKVQG